MSFSIIITTGSFIFHNSNTTFREANNADKLPDDVVNVARFLLDIDDDPYVVSDANLSTYLRQYSGQIRSPYSRSVSYGTPSSLARTVYGHLVAGEMKDVAQLMLNYDYEYLVTSNEEKDRKTAIDEAGFDFIKQVNSYGIYKVTGIRTELRQYNDDHQLVSMTYVDEEGNPASRSDKIYVKYENEYLDDGRLSLTRFYDTDGNIVNYGTYNFHIYIKHLLEMKDQGNIIFISIRNEGTNSLTQTIIDDLSELGIQKPLLGKFRYSYYAIIEGDSIREELSKQALSYSGRIENVQYTISSAGYDCGDYSTIMIDGNEYSWNSRGMNIVIYNPSDKAVEERVVFDTYAFEMRERK